jgi:hypothetical protein
LSIARMFPNEGNKFCCWPDRVSYKMCCCEGGTKPIHYEKQKSYLASKKVANPPNCFCYDYKFELAIQLLKNCNNYVITY